MFYSSNCSEALADAQQFRNACDANLTRILDGRAMQIMRMYDEDCFFFIDRVYDCASDFIRSLKTSVGSEYKKSLKLKGNFSSKFVHKELFTTTDQIFEITSICNGTVEECFRTAKFRSPCTGFAYLKILDCSIQDYVKDPSIYFRCNETWLAREFSDSTSSNILSQNIELFVIFSFLRTLILLWSKIN